MLTLTAWPSVRDGSISTVDPAAVAAAEGYHPEFAVVRSQSGLPALTKGDARRA
jgi:hypothetical protein